jgi:hypothetical protein
MEIRILAGLIYCYFRYEKSKDGWNEKEKRKEMLVPQARYLIARSAIDPNDVKGFLHFQMVQEETMDDDIMANCAYW